MKKIFKTMLLLAAVTTGTGALVSCSDDEDLTTADALFRPIINVTDNIETGLDDSLAPYMIIKWDNYTNADQYTVKVEATDGSDSKEITTQELSCRFDNLQYDKEYYVYISSANTKSGLSSKPFSLTTTTPDYPTYLASPASTDLIDTQARVKWSEVNYDNMKVYKDNEDQLVIDTVLTEAINEQKELILKGLEPQTTYRAQVYSNGKYLGKKRFTTTAAEKFDGVVIDLRGVSGGDTYINSDQLAADVAANPDQDITYVLEGGTMYKISGGTVIPGTSKTIKFVTGLTLAGNATFRSGGGMGAVAGADVNAIVYEKIDFISDKAIEGGGNEVATNHDKGWGGRQVFNINNYGATIGSITFKNCSMTGYRAVVRSQQDGDNINNILFENCAINAIGDQGVVTTTNKKADWRNVTFRNCTITNIVMLCDFRASVSTLNLTIENSTFCYAPIETTANANTPMFRLGSGNVVLKVKNTLFGPSMASGATKQGVFSLDGSGSQVQTYTAGAAGSIFLSGTPDNLDVQDCYKTDFAWTDLNTTGEGDPKIYPLEGLGELGLNESALWSKPTEGLFNIIGKVSGVDLSKLGDSRWW